MRTTTILALTVVLSGLGTNTAGAQEAQELWTKNCASCHGADMKGQTKAGLALKVKDLTAPEIRAAFDRERMIKATKEGITREGSDKPVM